MSRRGRASARRPSREIPRDGPKLTGAELHERLAATWARPPGLVGWLSSVDHKDIGRRYLVTALVFLALGRHSRACDAAAARRARQRSHRRRSLQPDLHHARHDDDVPVRRAR